MKKILKIRIRPINTENKLTVARGEGDGGLAKKGEGEWETHPVTE